MASPKAPWGGRKGDPQFRAPGSRSPWAKRPARPGCAPAEDRSPKKKSGGARPPAPPAGAREPRRGPGWGATARPGPQLSSPTPLGVCCRLPDLGCPGRSGCQVPAAPLSYPQVPGAWLGARAGGRLLRCLTDLTGPQIPACRRLPARSRRCPGSGGISDFPAASGFPPRPNLPPQHPLSLGSRLGSARMTSLRSPSGWLRSPSHFFRPPPPASPSPGPSGLQRAQ